MSKWLFLVLILFSSCRQDSTRDIQDNLTGNANVILFTLDGVRYEEFFDKQIFEKFWRVHAKKGIVLGDPSRSSKVRTANTVSLSLPAYRTIHTGERTWCRTNNCDHVRTETLMEKLNRVKNWDHKKVAVISSWKKICRAAMREESSVYHNCSNTPLEEPGHEDLNTQQESDLPPWNHARRDKYTFEHGLRFIKNQRPRFLHLSLLDSDKFAHDRDWNSYIASLRTYDDYIERLYGLLEGMGEYGKKTTVIITTDHGRNAKDRFHSHVLSWHARKIWMVIKGADIPARGSLSHNKKITHLHIRPFTELLLGVKEIKGKNRLFNLSDLWSSDSVVH